MQQGSTISAHLSLFLATSLMMEDVIDGRLKLTLNFFFFSRRPSPLPMSLVLGVQWRKSGSSAPTDRSVECALSVHQDPPSRRNPMTVTGVLVPGSCCFSSVPSQFLTSGSGIDSDFVIFKSFFRVFMEFFPGFFFRVLGAVNLIFRCFWDLDFGFFWTWIKTLKVGFCWVFESRLLMLVIWFCFLTFFLCLVYGFWGGWLAAGLLLGFGCWFYPITCTIADVTQWLDGLSEFSHLYCLSLLLFWVWSFNFRCFSIRHSIGWGLFWIWEIRLLWDDRRPFYRF